MTTETIPLLLVGEAARGSAQHERNIIRLIAEGKLRAFGKGSRRYITEEDLMAALIADIALLKDKIRESTRCPSCGHSPYDDAGDGEVDGT